MKPVTDPSTLNWLNGGDNTSQPAQVKGGGINIDTLKPVEDPGVLANLDFGIDVNKSKDDVRSQISKLPADQRVRALRLWADHFVSKEAESNPISTGIDDTVRTISRGSFIGPALDELSAATYSPSATVRAAIGGIEDEKALPYYEALEYQRARDRAVDDSHPVLSFAGKIAGGVAGGVGAVKALASGDKIKQAAGMATGGPFAAFTPTGSMPSRIAQSSGMGAVYGAPAGFASGEGGIGERFESAKTGAEIGAGLGAILPPTLALGSKTVESAGNALSPTIARAKVSGRNWLENAGLIEVEKTPKSAGAAANVDSLISQQKGADAAAEQMIADQLTRSGVTVQELRDRLGSALDSSRFHSNSRGSVPLAIMDLDPSLQRLLGSASRQQPEAAELAQSFNFTRQTGLTPPNNKLPENHGLQHRPIMSKVEDDIPRGQFERLRDGLKRAFLIKDEDWHGLGANAHQADKILLKRARENARPYYKKAYDASEGVDISVYIKPVIDKWINSLDGEPIGVHAPLKRAMKQFTNKNGIVKNFEQADKGKQFIDNDIEKYFQGNSIQRYVGMKIREFNDDIIAALDKIEENNIGKLYESARNEFSDPMQMRKILQMGKDVWRDDSEIVVGHFNDLKSKGEQKMFRFGLLGGFENKMSRAKRTADVTQEFESPRVQEILESVIERGGPKTVFKNRPERFGKFVQGEKRMIGSRDEVLGNSKTAQRIADDEAYANLESINTMFREFALQPSTSNLLIKGVESALYKIFGMRADTATAIANKLLTADPDMRREILQRIGDRMGPKRSELFAQFMHQYQNLVINPTIRTTTGMQE